MREEALRIENVTRAIDGVTYLDNINFTIYKGEIMGFIFLNAQGKEALIDLLAQNLPINVGRIYIANNLVNYYEHSNMSLNRVYVIDQDSRLIEDLTVADNISVLNREYRDYFVNREKIHKTTQELLHSVGITIEIGEYVSNLSLFEKCVIELVKAVSVQTSLIILNELSSYLTVTELAKFHELVRHYTDLGFTFLYIVNHHEEAFKICDRVSLLEDGRVVKIFGFHEFLDENVAPYIAAFDPKNSDRRIEKEQDGILTFEDVSSTTLDRISFSIQKGECVAILDMNNTFIADIMSLMRGEESERDGQILLDGARFGVKRRKNYLEAGITFISENPTRNMLFENLSYMDNLTFLLDRKLKRSIIRSRIRENVGKEYGRIVGNEIAAEDLRNMDQKSLYNLIYYRIHLFNPKIVFCIQPFSNQDMYLRRHIIGLINALKGKGISVVILAYSIADSLFVADRLLTIEDGKLKREYAYADFSLFQR